MSQNIKMFIAQPAGVHYNRGVSSLKAVSEQSAKMLITLERSGMKPKVRARAPELSPEPEYLIFRFFQN